jgi:acetyltransferase-like isoleucine patch superfamily enzyme
MPFINWLLTFLRSASFRCSPSLRYLHSLSVTDAVEFSVKSTSSLRGSILCQEASLVVMDNVVIAQGTEINAVSGGTIYIGNGVRIGKSSVLSVAEGGNLVIGQRTSFFSNIYLSGEISIGCDCLFGPNVTILTYSHIIADRRPIRIQDAEYLSKHEHPPYKPVCIGDDCWIGVNAVILPGVKLGRGCVVGAGAVVTNSFDDYSIITGVPARLLRNR